MTSVYIVQVHLSDDIIAVDNGNGEERWISDKVKVHKGCGGVFVDEKTGGCKSCDTVYFIEFLGKPGCLSTYLVVQDDS